jgi:hypothetical protein
MSNDKEPSGAQKAFGEFAPAFVERASAATDTRAAGEPTQFHHNTVAD